MAELSERTAFPSLPLKHWWALRSLFRTSVPTVVDAAYLSNRLGQGTMTIASARNNVLPALKHMGLIDAEGKPTDLVHKWKMDSSFAEACHEILKTAYPQSLIDTVPPDEAEFEAAKRWFMSVAKLGENAARKAATTYLLICEADPSKQVEAKTTTSKRPRRGSAAPKVNAKSPNREASPEQIMTEIQSHQTETMATRELVRDHPSLHIDIQIHISPDAEAEQIDGIFASMARHLYSRDGSNSE